MRSFIFPALAVAVGTGSAPVARAQTEPAALVRSLERAVDRDRADSARLSWRRDASRRPRDPAPRFALAMLDRLEFRNDRAQVGLTTLARSPLPTTWRAAAQLSLGRLLVGTGDPGGVTWLRSAVATSDSVGSAAASTAAAARIELARAMARSGALDSARSLIDQARAMVPPADSSLAALAACSAGGAVTTSAPGRADSLIAHGAALAEATGDQRALARCLTAAYQSLMNRGLAARSVAPLSDALKAIEKTRDAETAATINQLRAFMYIQFSYGIANGRRHATTAIQLARASGNRLALGYAHLNLAQFAIRVGDFRTAARRRDSAVVVLRAIGDRPGQAAAEFVAGDAAFATGDLAEARRAYRAAHALYSQLRSPVAGVNQRLALVAVEAGQFGEARRLLEEAGTEATRTGNRGVASDRSYYDGLLALRDGRFLEAAGAFRRYREALHPGALQYRLDSGTREAEALALAGRLDEAAMTLDSALAAIERVRSGVIDRGSNNRDAFLALASNRRFEFDPDLGLATIVATFARAGRVDAAFRFSEAERARLLWVRVTRRAMLRDSASTGLGNVFVPPDLPLADLTRALADHSALIAFSTGAGGEPTTVFVLDRRGLRAFPAPSGDSLTVPVQRFATMAAAGTWGRSLGRTLAASLLDQPLASLDPGVRRLILIPDGPLHRLPFDALPLADGNPLLTRFEVSYVPSARLAGEWLNAPPTAAGSRSGVVAFGDPSFDPGFGLPRIRGSGIEARLATGGGSRGASLVRAAASEAAFHGLDSKPTAVIHLATHARTEDAGALASAVFLAPGNGHDGRLGPEEIAARRLSVDLVMLTGCRTSGGALMFGEGVQGLVVPFLEAGARAVVATLWDVGDERIVPLVRRIYGELERGNEVGAALRTARLASWRSGESPAIWAGITVTGNPRVRPLAGAIAPSSR